MINFISFFYLYFLVVFSLLLFIITLLNIFLSILFTRKNKNFELINLKDKTPLVSVLVPARNEEKNIDRCVNSLIEQSYSNIEVIILDDDSSDNTYFISNEISKSDSRVSVIKGKKIPKGWLGKNWACHQLSQKATGDFFLFIDSDTKLKPNLILDSIKIHINEDLALLSGINPDRVVLFTWLIVAALATTAGVLYGLDKSFKPFTYFSILLPIFAAAIGGGIGSPIGAVVGGYVIAFSEIMVTYAYKKFFMYLLPESLEPQGLVQLLSTDYKFAVSFSILVIVLLVRPSGIFKGKTL